MFSKMNFINHIGLFSRFIKNDAIHLTHGDSTSIVWWTHITVFTIKSRSAVNNKNATNPAAIPIKIKHPQSNMDKSGFANANAIITAATVSQNQVNVRKRCTLSFLFSWLLLSIVVFIIGQYNF
jgi:hypothetical protein